MTKQVQTRMEDGAPCGFRALVALVAFLRPTRLILTPDALVHAHPYGPPRRIAWRDIKRFETVRSDDAAHHSASQVVMYKLRPGVAAPGPLAPVYRACARLDGSLAGSWRTEAEDLLSLLESRHRDARVSRKARAAGRELDVKSRRLGRQAG